MTYADFCLYLERINQTTKRLEITSILANLIKNLDAREIEKALFLSLGYLNPPYNQIKFNMADKMVVKALSLAYKKDLETIENMYSKEGDLGDVASILCNNKKGQGLSVLEVYSMLLDIAQQEGTGSQERKLSKLGDLLLKLNSLEAKYAVKIVLGTTRLGFTEQTIIDALSVMETNSKLASSKIEEVYNIYPNIGFLASIVKKDGLDALKSIKAETGIPILPQRAQRLSDPNEIIKKMEGTAWVEYKFDGTRVQLHIDKTKPTNTTKFTQSELFSLQDAKFLIKTFTRNLEESTHQFPDIIQMAINQISAQSVILDGEAVGYDFKSQKFIPFQETIQRKRKYDVEKYAKEIPLKYIIFDILYINGAQITHLPLKERVKILKDVIKESDLFHISEHHEVHNPNEIWELFELSKEKNLEGIMIKNPNASYRAGAREFSWIKLKKSDTDILEDTIDCVVLGYYYGKGNRANFGIGGFLCGIWNKDKQVFTTLTKVGTGLKDEEWINLKQKCDKIKLKNQPKNVIVDKILAPDIWVEPKIVVELGGDEISTSPIHTSGYALRFPRFIRYREDKAPTDTTSLQEIKAMQKSLENSSLSNKMEETN